MRVFESSGLPIRMSRVPEMFPDSTLFWGTKTAMYRSVDPPGLMPKKAPFIWTSENAFGLSPVILNSMIQRLSTLLRGLRLVNVRSPALNERAVLGMTHWYAGLVSNLNFGMVTLYRLPFSRASCTFLLTVFGAFLLLTRRTALEMTSSSDDL